MTVFYFLHVLMQNNHLKKGNNPTNFSPGLLNILLFKKLKKNLQEIMINTFKIKLEQT